MPTTSFSPDTNGHSVTGNRLSCDCRLAWMHTLLNETPNEHIKNVLEELTCFWNDSEHDEGGVAPLTSHSHAHAQSRRPPHTHHEPPNDVTGYDEEYEEEFGQQRHLLGIATEALPCPEATRQATDSPLTADNHLEGLLTSAASTPVLDLGLCAALLLGVLVT